MTQSYQWPLSVSRVGPHPSVPVASLAASSLDPTNPGTAPGKASMYTTSRSHRTLKNCVLRPRVWGYWPDLQQGNLPWLPSALCSCSGKVVGMTYSYSFYAVLLCCYPNTLTDIPGIRFKAVVLQTHAPTHSHLITAGTILCLIFTVQCLDILLV